jgi:carbon-monoxide dehydrogenase small subunit
MTARKQQVAFSVNGTDFELHVPAGRVLLDILRDDLGLTGTKEGCREGRCGACTVHVGGRAVSACLVLAPDIDGKSITTIEGIAKEGRLIDLQKAFIDEGAVQCGYCTPGMIMLAVDLVARNPNPTESDVREAMAGNLCRCTGYEKIVKAVLKTAEDMRQTRLRMIQEAVKRKNAAGRRRRKKGARRRK